jgi:hypothetical protein
MSDLTDKINQLGKWVTHTAKSDTWELHQDRRKLKKSCGFKYPYCREHLVITFHHITNPKNKPTTVNVRCHICKKSAVVDINQWNVDVAKSKKSE